LKISYIKVHIIFYDLKVFNLRYLLNKLCNNAKSSIHIRDKHKIILEKIQAMYFRCVNPTLLLVLLFRSEGGYYVNV